MKMATGRSVAIEGDGKLIISITIKENELIYLGKQKGKKWLGRMFLPFQFFMIEKVNTC